MTPTDIAVLFKDFSTYWALFWSIFWNCKNYISLFAIYIAHYRLLGVSAALLIKIKIIIIFCHNLKFFFLKTSYLDS